MEKLTLLSPRFMQKTFLILFFCAAIFLQIHKIHRNEMWFDEIETDLYSYKTLTSLSHWLGLDTQVLLMKKVLSDSHSPGYGLLVYLYSALFGGGENIRYLSVVSSALSLWLLYLCAVRIVKKQEAVFAVALLAYSPLILWYSQEARGYSLFLALGLTQTLFLLRSLQEKSFQPWVGYALMGGINLLFEPTLLIMSGAFGLIYYLYKDWERLRIWGVITAVLIVEFFVFTIFLKSYFLFVRQSLSWVPFPTIQSLFATCISFNLGYSATFLQHVVAVLLFLPLFLWGAVTFLRERTKTSIVVVLCLLIPIGGIFLLSRLGWYFYLERRMIIVLPFYFIILAKAVFRLKPVLIRRMIQICIFFLMGISIGNYFNGYVSLDIAGNPCFTGIHKKKDYRMLFDAFLPQGDIPVFAADLQAWKLLYAYYRPWERPQFNEKIHGLIFCPSVLLEHERVYILRESRADFPLDNQLYVAELNARFARGPVMMVGQFNRSIGMFGTGDSDSAFTLVSAAWDSTLSENAEYVRKYLDDSYDRTFSFVQEGMRFDSYQRKNVSRGSLECSR